MWKAALPVFPTLASVVGLLWSSTGVVAPGVVNWGQGPLAGIGTPSPPALRRGVGLHGGGVGLLYAGHMVRLVTGLRWFGLKARGIRREAVRRREALPSCPPRGRVTRVYLRRGGPPWTSVQ